MKNLRITVNGVAYDVQVEELGSEASVSAPVAPVKAAAPAPAEKAAPKTVGEGMKVAAPMPGTIVSVNVSDGQAFKKGDVLIVLEAMKMENEIKAPKDGTVTGVSVNKGESVDTGATLVTIG